MSTSMAPRFSGLLRAALRGENFDVAKEKQRRDREAREHERVQAVKAGGGEGTLSWGAFVEGVEDTDEGRMRKMRASYNLFMAELKDVVGDESSSGALHEMAFTVFNVLADEDTTTQAKTSTLTKLLGEAPSRKAFDSLQTLVTTLTEWKKDRQAEQELKRSIESIADDLQLSNAGAVGDGSGMANRREFGHDLLFSFDTPDFLSKAPKVKASVASKGGIEVVRPQKQHHQPQSQPPVMVQQRPQKVDVPGKLNWLEDECRKYAQQNKMAAADLFKSVIAIAKSAGSADVLQGQLFDLLGAEGLELMGMVVEKWDAVKQLSQSTSLPSVTAPSATKAEGGSGPYVPMSDSMSVVIDNRKLSQREKKKQLKQKQQQQQQQQAAPGHVSSQQQAAQQGLSDEQRDRFVRYMQGGDRSELPSVARNDYIAGGSATQVSEVKFALPEGAKRSDSQDYESVWLPPKYPTTRSDDNLVPVTEFEPWAQGAFKGFQRLNRIQSAVFHSAYRTNENLLICAPTGAGKTNIAMLTILRELGVNRVDGAIQKDQFKIVYVAPMKALAAEMTAGFGSRLQYLGISVRELTGDMQLTKQEIEETQIIVTTPEKWDVITRKSTDSPLTQLVHLLIIDEVHLLNEDRGPVIETLVARTLRQVEASQSMIRIVGLSATLPNYRDVAQFMRVNESGLHFFDGSYRPVPLEQTFVGVKPKQFQKQREVMTRYACDTIIQTIRKGKQCMVFVHSRKDTVRTAQELLELAEENGTADLIAADVKEAAWAQKEIDKSRNSDIKRLFAAGFGCHHAGMLRSDRNLVESMFHKGMIKVLCCTATLAWGVNLPCKQVIIKGTQVYNAEKGKFTSLGMLDVMQIFGRAGRPQYDDEGSAVLITTHEELNRYLALTSHQAPIESQFIAELADNLNAEIVLGTVTNVQEAVTWMSYTYLYVRMLRNPMVYGISYEERQLDPTLVHKRTELIAAAAQELDDVRMIRFNNPYFSPTNMGQTASHFYIHHDTIRTFNETFERAANNITLPEVFRLICNATEFDNVVTRDEELVELDKLKANCPVEIKGDAAGDKAVKVNILMQAHISRANVQTFALVCDSNFIAQNSARIARGLFEIALRKNLPDAASLLLKLCKMIELRLWDFMHPLRQFPNVKEPLIYKFEQRQLTVDKLLDMDASEISAITRVPAATSSILTALEQIPYLEVDTSVQPITRTIIRIKLTITPAFKWSDRIHGSVQPFWIWVENPEDVGILHSEYFLLRKKDHRQSSEVIFTTPISHPIPAQYVLHVCSDRWLGSDNTVALSFKNLILPKLYPPNTKLLDLQPLPVSALQNPQFEKLYGYSYFNPIQTQIFHTIYHTDQNVLLGAPTGSGKTVAAELAVLRLFREYPKQKAVYLGPLKALVQERLKDWDRKFVSTLRKKMVELTGEFTPDVQALKEADIICTTPEKWDGVSRSWHNRGYVKRVGLIIIDEIHLLGEDRGPILEVIVSRMRFIASQTRNPIRVIGLSTALANAKDLAEWLGIEPPGLFNFHPSVRPVPLKIHVQGYDGKAYCPRMAKMNRPAYAAILAYSPSKPVLIFVSSRRQTRLTALDIISHVVADGQPQRFVTGANDVLTRSMNRIRDTNLKHSLSFGIGLHHAGLAREDKAIVEELFASCTIQVLISTATLAWGVNLPAHLVIIKGGEYFDPKSRRYVDYAITDMLQMMGRAGRPQFDDSGEAVIMCTTAMKGFYKKFLYEPFPVESSLANVLHEHLNAEIVAGTLKTKYDAVDYLTWTYLYRRLLVNPAYYGVESSKLGAVNKFLSSLVDDALAELEKSHCLELDAEDGVTVYPLVMGQIVSYYYLSHRTARLFFDRIEEDSTLEDLLDVLCSAAEYDELPVRHNEELLNEELAQDDGMRLPMANKDWEDPHVKANLLLQAHFSRTMLPISDYVTDQKSVLDQSIRILQAMVDVAADGGWLFTALRCMQLVQMVVQAQWLDESSFNQIPYFDSFSQHKQMEALGFRSLPQLLNVSPERQRAVLQQVIGSRKDRLESAVSALAKFPLLQLNALFVEKVAKDAETPTATEKSDAAGVDEEDKKDDTTTPSTRAATKPVDGIAVARAGKELLLEVRIRRDKGGQAKGMAFCPFFGKAKREGWWIVVGDDSGELFALKRITLRGGSSWQTFTVDLTLVPEVEDDEEMLFEAQPAKILVDKKLWVYVMSDSYIGLDMMTSVPVKMEADQERD